jgi:hypothetical protein
MIEVTIAIPPRTLDNQTYRDAYISFAIPDLSNKAAMKIKSGTDMST